MKTELQKWNPLADFSDIGHRLHNLLPGLWGGNGFRSELFKDNNWEPAVDIEEDDKNYLITADLPDVKKEDVKVSIKDGILTVSGKRESKEEEKNKTYHRIERFHGSYERKFCLPEDIFEEKLDAHFKGGVLKITLPKEPGKKKESERQINVH